MPGMSPPRHRPIPDRSGRERSGHRRRHRASSREVGSRVPPAVRAPDRPAGIRPAVAAAGGGRRSQIELPRGRRRGGERQQMAAAVQGGRCISGDDRSQFNAPGRCGRQEAGSHAGLHIALAIRRRCGHTARNDRYALTSPSSDQQGQHLAASLVVSRGRVSSLHGQEASIWPESSCACAHSGIGGPRRWQPIARPGRRDMARWPTRRPG